MDPDNYRVCRDCTLALTNGDLSHLDPDSARYADVRRGVEAAPLLALVGPIDPDESDVVDDCEVCGQAIFAEDWHEFEVATITGGAR